MHRFQSPDPRRHHEQVLRRRTVEELTGLSKSQIYALIAKGQFPPQVQLSARSVGWLQSSIEAWITSRQQVKLIRPGPTQPGALAIPRSSAQGP